MSTAALTVTLRAHTRKSHARKLRRAGRIPGVIYGPKIPTYPIEIPAREFERMIHHTRQRLFDVGLQKNGETESFKVVIREIQREIIDRKILHVDLYAVDQEKPMTLDIPIILTGSSPGVAEGGLLHELRRALPIRCLPKDLIEEIYIDISALGIGQTIHVSDLNLPDTVECLEPDDTPLVTVAKKESEAVATEEGEEETAEPTEGTAE
ncbi:MAG: 50S ribosomal protein L25 [Deltaproteobacteria bacterium]|nr:MAG: 50S ribosomal protein L25 [Deltaproteobacteria bacterium]